MALDCLRWQRVSVELTLPTEGLEAGKCFALMCVVTPGGGLPGTSAALPALQLAVGIRGLGSRHSLAEGQGGSTSRRAAKLLVPLNPLNSDLFCALLPTSLQ